MKKIILVIAGIIFLIILSVGAMFVFNICPPQGPWPTPPWCSAGFIKYEYEVNVVPSYLPQVRAVNMYDTWGRNYNMNMIETTQANIESSFNRAESLGSQEIYIHDFDRAVYDNGTDFKSQNYQLVDEIFLNDMRDESISANDLKILATNAHNRGMKLGVKRNLSFVNIGKYIKDGIKGDISSAVANDYKEFNAFHSEDWISNYFQKWESRMLEKGKMYQAAGVDIMSISPSFQEPTFAGHEKLANDLWKNLIAKLRTVFKGKIMVDFNIYGFLDGRNNQEDWTQYDYYKDVDIAEVKIYNILEKYWSDGGRAPENIQKEIEKMVFDLDKKAAELGIKISLFYAPSSYENGIFNGPVEYLDFKNPTIVNLKKDYNTQALAFDYFFVAVKDKQNIERINVGNFAWDDALDPEVNPRVSVAAGFRNKAAEEVVGAWFNFLKEK